MKKRSASYPSKTLIDTERFAVSVFEKVGDTILKYAELAKHGNVPVREADSFASTACQYGWMTQMRGKGYSPNSAICKALRTPHNEEEKKKIYLDGFLSPHLYKLIATEGNGKKVTDEGLKISLIRDHEFSDAGAKLASKVFFENASFLGLIDDDGNFNIDADIKIDLDKIKGKRVKSKAVPPQSTKKPSVEKNSHKQAEPKFSGGGSSGQLKKISIFVRGQELHLPLPDSMTQSDWDAVIKQLQNIKSFSK